MSRGGSRAPRASIADPDWLARKLDSIFGGDGKKTDIVGEMLLRKLPVHFGGVSDPFSNRSVAKRSVKILTALREHDFPVIISTKNTSELLRKEVVNFLKGIKYLIVQISISAPNDKFSGLIEPNVPGVSERIESIKTLNKEGIYAIVRLQPLFIPWIQEIVNDLICRVSSSGCKHVIVECLKVPVEYRVSSFVELFKKIGWDGYTFYQQRGAQLIGREWVLPPKYKWELLQPLIQAIHRYGMRYGSGDYGLNHLGDTECCCGIDEVEGFSNWFRGNFATVIRNSATGYVSFGHVIKHWIPTRSVKRYMNSKCRLSGDNSILSYLRHKWNSPGTVNAPDSFLGVVWNGEHDQDGNCIYLKESIL